MQKEIFSGSSEHRSSQQDSHARTSALLAIVKACTGTKVDCSLKFYELLKRLKISRTLFSKMSPTFFPVTKEGIWRLSSKGWKNSGIRLNTGFLTAKISEAPLNVEGESLSLADLLQEDSDVDPKYYLSPKACTGILRRARKSKRPIPETLEKALETVAEQSF